VRRHTDLGKNDAPGDDFATADARNSMPS